MAIVAKWTELRVQGKRITKQQAEDIIVRTELWPLSCNDQNFANEVNKIFGFSDLFSDLGTNSAARARLKLIDLNYLHNSQIVSSWIFGTHGWCQWDGRIQCAGFNIGKWPSSLAVTEDLMNVAWAFPFLDMAVQTMSGEAGEDTVVTDMWRVQKGEVIHVFDDATSSSPPKPLEAASYFASDDKLVKSINSRCERGTDLGKLMMIAQRMLEKGLEPQVDS